MTDSTESNASIRAHVARARRERDLRAMWFYGTWLFNRYYGTAIVVNVVVAAACVVASLVVKADVL
ncbi:hypothetical protein [Curtobacterium sp. MCLR17_034]|uniref:hypothetical protein n=1 Tax=Curtobacterium sp. MCLR17_034 TaxID=2175623 RepID=UPI000DA82DB6|nr:hypothetical protein [Curtobacterium sp. MCLR17_034]PZF11736.1 hypothetical protein DEI98_06350 [Curtobacterium sp. MCLR17_034]